MVGITNKVYCYMAGSFFSTARGLIGYFEVTYHLHCTNEAVPPTPPPQKKKSLTGQHCKKSMMSEGNNAMLPANVD